jgi:hypothetical protein
MLIPTIVLMIELRTSVEKADAASVLELIDAAVGKSGVEASIHNELLRIRALVCVSLPNEEDAARFLKEFRKISRFRLQWAEHSKQLPENELNASPGK